MNRKDDNGILDRATCRSSAIRSVPGPFWSDPRPVRRIKPVLFAASFRLVFLPFGGRNRDTRAKATVGLKRTCYLPFELRPVDFVVSSDVHRDDRIILDQELKRDPIRDVDRYRIQAREFATKLVEMKRRMRRVQLEKLQGLFVLPNHIRMALDEPSRTANVRIGVEDFSHS